jgi:hypothetical protein
MAFSMSSAVGVGGTMGVASADLWNSSFRSSLVPGLILALVSSDMLLLLLLGHPALGSSSPKVSWSSYH